MIHESYTACKKYRGFIFNADNTIFDYDRAEKEALYETFLTLNIFIPFEKIHLNFKRINNYLWGNILKHKLSMDTFKVELFRLLLAKLEIECNPYELSDFYLNCLSHKAYLLPNTVQVLERLSKKAMLCLITNGFEYVQKSRIARANIEVFFNEIFISEVLGIIKPNPAIFKIASEKLFIQPYDILCVGNNPSTDIRGGFYAGMDTCWFSPELKTYPLKEPEPTIVISNFTDLISFTTELS